MRLARLLSELQSCGASPEEGPLLVAPFQHIYTREGQYCASEQKLEFGTWPCLQPRVARCVWSLLAPKSYASVSTLVGGPGTVGSKRRRTQHRSRAPPCVAAEKVALGGPKQTGLQTVRLFRVAALLVPASTLPCASSVVTFGTLVARSGAPSRLRPVRCRGAWHGVLPPEPDLLALQARRVNCARALGAPERATNVPNVTTDDAHSKEEAGTNNAATRKRRTV